MTVEEQLAELESWIAQYELTNTDVSNSTIGWQIDHSLKVLSGVMGTLKASDPSAYKWKFNWQRTVFLGLEYFPRGKVRAPKSVTPMSTADDTMLLDAIQKAKHQLSQIKELPPNSWFKHPFFGQLNLERALHFMKVHTHHHLKIIRKISNK